MSSRVILHGALLALGAHLTACTLQRAPQMSRPSLDESATPTAARPTAAPPEASDEPVVGSAAVAGSEIVGTNATVLVRAPVARVREVLFDCARYPEFLPSYKACTDLGTSARGGRETRMEIEELGGLIKIWLRVETAKVASEGGAEVYEGRLLDGNIKAFSSRWRLVPVERGFTRLTLESHLDPKLPLPAALINGGTVDGMREAILAIKRRAEQAGAEVR